MPQVSLMRGEKPLILKQKQREYCDWTQPWRYRYWQGGFGARKSTTLCAAVIELCMLFPKNRWLIGRKNFTDLEKTTMKTFFMICPREIIKNYNQTKHVVTFVNDSEIVFAGCEDWEAFKSLELGGFALDEANQLEENLFLLLTSRIINRLPDIPTHYCFGLLASNPPTSDHWLHKKFIKEKDPMFKQFFSSTRENIEDSTSEEERQGWIDYVENLERVYAHDPQLVDVVIDGKYGFAMGSKRVYPEFNPQIHVGSFQPVEGKVVHRTWDRGYNHPACLWSQYDENDRLIHLFEDLGRDIIFSRFRDKIIERTNVLFPWKPHIIDYIDWSGTHKSDTSEENCVEILRKKGLRPRWKKFEFVKARDMVGLKLQTLNDGKPGLLINNACSILIEGFKGGFRFPTTPDGKAEKEYPLQDGYYEHLNECDLILNFNLGSTEVHTGAFEQPNMARSYGVSRL